LFSSASRAPGGHPGAVEAVELPRELAHGHERGERGKALEHPQQVRGPHDSDRATGVPRAEGPERAAVLGIVAVREQRHLAAVRAVTPRLPERALVHDRRPRHLHPAHHPALGDVARTRPGGAHARQGAEDDARQLVDLTEALTNRRKRRMRSELRQNIGEALGVPKKHRDALDCIESDQAFLLLKGDGSLDRSRFDADALRPLLRQAVVAIAAAVETYVADRACSLVGLALRGESVPERMRKLPINIGDVADIERTNERRA